MQMDKERSNVFQCCKDGRFKRTKDDAPAVGMLAVAMSFATHGLSD
jgi:hypothetical protein